MSDIHEIASAGLEDKEVLYWGYVHDDGEPLVVNSMMHVVVLHGAYPQSGLVRISDPYERESYKEVRPEDVIVTKEDLHGKACLAGAKRIETLEWLLEEISSYGGKGFFQKLTSPDPREYEQAAQCTFLWSNILDDMSCQIMRLAYPYDNPDTGYSYWRQYLGGMDSIAGERETDIYEEETDRSLLVDIYDYETMAAWLCDMYAGYLVDTSQLTLF